jgi:hypothetical protein
MRARAAGKHDRAQHHADVGFVADLPGVLHRAACGQHIVDDQGRRKGLKRAATSNRVGETYSAARYTKDVSERAGVHFEDQIGKEPDLDIIERITVDLERQYLSAMRPELARDKQPMYCRQRGLGALAR